MRRKLPVSKKVARGRYHFYMKGCLVLHVIMCLCDSFLPSSSLLGVRRHADLKIKTWPGKTLRLQALSCDGLRLPIATNSLGTAGAKAGYFTGS